MEVAAQSSGAILNHSSIGRDCQVDAKAVGRYFQILQDTLLGYALPAYARSVRKQQRQAPKFYLFDLGVQRALRGALSIPVEPRSYDYGRCFEQLVILEIYRLNQYLSRDLKLSYLRTKDDAEIDLIIERPDGRSWLVEIKSTTQVSDEDVTKIERFITVIPNSTAIILSNDSTPRTVGRTRVLPWQQGIREILGL